MLVNIFLTMKSVVIDTLRKDGDNNYVIKNQIKSHIEKNGMLEYEFVLDNDVK